MTGFEKKVKMYCLNNQMSLTDFVHSVGGSRTSLYRAFINPTDRNTKKFIDAMDNKQKKSKQMTDFEIFCEEILNRAIAEKEKEQNNEQGH